MGSAWCKERSIASQASKSPLDRVIVQCVSQMYPCERATENGREDNNGVTRDKPVVSPPMPMRSTSHAMRSKASSGWQDVTLSVPDSTEGQPTTSVPVPPPRKKKLRRQEQERRREAKMGASSSPEPSVPPQRCQDPEYCSGNSLLKPRPKNVSTVSLPNFSEWTGKSGGSTLQLPSRNLSSNSLSDRESSSLKSLKSSTAERLDSYMKKCRSFAAFLPDELVDKINQARDFSSDDEDHWGGLDDWDLGVIEHCDNHDTGPPVEPRYKLHRRSKNLATTDEKMNNIIKPISKTNDKDAKSVELKGSQVRDDLDNDDMSSIISDNDSPDIPEGTIEGNPFLDQGNNEDWFDNHYSPQEEYKDIKDIKIKDTSGNPTSTENRNLKTILYDFNRLVKSPPGSTSPKTTDKRSSAENKTPPPSPESRRDSEDFFIHKTDDSTQDGGNKGMDHCNLLKILREFKSLDSKDRDKDAEKVLTDLGLPMSLREDENRNTEDETLHNKLNGNLGTKDADKTGLTLNIDGHNKNSSAASDSSGRSSMTPSLSELEAALTDLLEASAAANLEAEETNHPQPPVPVHKQPLPTISISTVPSNVQDS